VTESVALPPEPQVHRMPEIHTRPEPTLIPIERPRCPRCQNRMHLARIMPGEPGFELRNFECVKCDEIITRTVAADPMQLDAARWLVGDLRPPE
jgi:hypothetical protein